MQMPQLSLEQFAAGIFWQGISKDNPLRTFETCHMLLAMGKNFVLR
jgi:hypothetical protein